jgi:hypothetical protein
MSIVKAFLSVLAVLTISGCASLSPMSESSPRTFSYNYSNLDKSKDELYEIALSFIATRYGDSNSVLRVTDKEQGLIIGRGSSSWVLSLNSCSAEHQIKFASKDSRARLQFELLEGAPAYSQCPGWKLPTQSGYNEIKSTFQSFSESLEAELRGKGNQAEFMDF